MTLREIIGPMQDWLDRLGPDTPVLVLREHYDHLAEAVQEATRLKSLLSDVAKGLRASRQLDVEVLEKLGDQPFQMMGGGYCLATHKKKEGVQAILDSLRHGMDARSKLAQRIENQTK